MVLAIVQSDIGAPVHGELYSPAGNRAPAIILAHEWWGLNDQMRGLARRFAAEGFHALALDLYGGKVTADPDEAMALSIDMKTSDAIAQIQAATDWLKTYRLCTGKVGVTGFCLGGAMAMAAACNVRGLHAVAPFYGLPLAQFADWSKVEAPIQGHYAKHDHYVQNDRLPAIQAAVQAAGGHAEFFLYEAGHAFLRETDPATYDAEAAALAWTRVVGFFQRNLG